MMITRRYKRVRSHRRRLHPRTVNASSLWDCAFRWRSSRRYDDEQRLRTSPLHGQLQGDQLPPSSWTV